MNDEAGTPETDPIGVESAQTDAVEPPPQMSPEAIAGEQVRGRMAGYFALGSALTMVASLAVLVLTLSGESVKDEAQKLLAIDQNPVGWIAMNLLAAISTAAMAPLLIHLAIAARTRRPTVPRMVQTLALAGPALVAISLPLQQVFQLKIANDFAAGDVQTVAAAREALKGTGFQIAASVGLAGAVALGFAFVMVSYYGIGTGLVTRFTGAVGIVIGFATVLPILGASGILQVFWLSALALMLIGPDSRKPPAWTAGRAVPWQRFAPVPAHDETDDGPAVEATSDEPAATDSTKP